MELPIAARPVRSPVPRRISDDVMSSVFGIDKLIGQDQAQLDVSEAISRLETISRSLSQKSSVNEGVGVSVQKFNELDSRLTRIEDLLKKINSLGQNPRVLFRYFDPINLIFLGTGLSIGTLVTFSFFYFVVSPWQNNDLQWLRTDSGKYARKLMDKNDAYILSGQCKLDAERQKIILKRGGKRVDACLIEMP